LRLKDSCLTAKTCGRRIKSSNCGEGVKGAKQAISKAREGTGVVFFKRRNYKMIKRGPGGASSAIYSGRARSSRSLLTTMLEGSGQKILEHEGRSTELGAFGSGREGRKIVSDIETAEGKRNFLGDCTRNDAGEGTQIGYHAEKILQGMSGSLTSMWKSKSEGEGKRRVLAFTCGRKKGKLVRRKRGRIKWRKGRGYGGRTKERRNEGGGEN